MKGKNNSNKDIYQSNHLLIYFELSDLFATLMLSVKVNYQITGFVNQTDNGLQPTSMISNDDHTNVFHYRTLVLAGRHQLLSLHIILTQLPTKLTSFSMKIFQ